MEANVNKYVIAPQQLGTLIIILAAIEIVGSLVILAIDKDASKVTYGGSVVLGIIFAASGYGVSKKNHIAYWIAMIFAVLALISGLIEACIAAGAFTLDGISKNWVSAICGIIVGLILTTSIIADKKQILE